MPSTPARTCNCSTCDLFNVVERALLVDIGLLDGKLRRDGICESLDFLLREIVLFGELFGLHLGGFYVELGFQAELAEPLVRVFCHLRRAVLRGNGRCLRALVHQLILKLGFRLLVGGFRALQLIFRVERLLLQLRIAEIENHRVRFHGRSGKQIALLDAPLGRRRDHPHGFRHEGAQPADFAKHRPALHGVGPDRRFVDARRRRLQARERSRHHDDHQQGRADIDVAADFSSAASHPAALCPYRKPHSYNAPTMQMAAAVLRERILIVPISYILHTPATRGGQPALPACACAPTIQPSAS